MALMCQHGFVAEPFVNFQWPGLQGKASCPSCAQTEYIYFKHSGHYSKRFSCSDYQTLMYRCFRNPSTPSNRFSRQTIVEVLENKHRISVFWKHVQLTKWNKCSQLLGVFIRTCHSLLYLISNGVLCRWCWYLKWHKAMDTEKISSNSMNQDYTYDCWDSWELIADTCGY